MRAPIEADDAAGSDRDGVLETLFVAHRDRLLRLCRGILGDHGDAEDAVQEAFTRAAPRLHQALDPAAYLVVVARNVCLEELRRRRTRDDARPLAPVAPPLDPEQSAVERDTVRQAWDGISADDRTVLGSAIAGRSLTETAHLLGTSVDAAAQRLSRARRRARQASLPAGVLVPLFGPVRTRLLGLRLHVLRPHGALLGRIQQLEGATAPVVVAVIVGTLAVAPAAAAHPAPGAGQQVRPLAAGGAAVANPAKGASDQGGSSATRALGTVAGAAKATLAPLSARHVSTGPGDPLTRSEATSFTPSPSYSSDHTIFAATSPTVSPCPTTTCAAVLRSSDSGRTWSVAGHDGGGPLLLAPAFPQLPRIFAVNAAGLEQSDDAGGSFRRVLPVSASPGFVPTAVVDPGSAADDPVIVVAASPSSLVTYDSGSGRASAGPVLPATTQKIDALLAAPGGGVYVDLETVGGGGMYLCGSATACSSVGPWVPGSPILSPTFSSDHTVFSGSGGGVTVAHLDGSDAHVLPVADVVARILPALDYASSGWLNVLVLHQQSDGGWQPQLLESVAGGPLQPSAARPWLVPMDAGTLALLPGGELIAGLQAHTGTDGPYGIAWSTDGGGSWSEGS